MELVPSWSYHIMLLDTVQHVRRPLLIFRVLSFVQDQHGTSSILVLLESCLQTCMTYTIAECTVNKLMIMGRGTVRNM